MFSRRAIVLSLLFLVAMIACVEGVRVARFYRDVTSARAALLSLKNDLDLEQLETTPEDVAAQRQELTRANARLASAAKFTDNDPFLRLATLLPIVDEQAKALRSLVSAAGESAAVGLAASEVARSFSSYERPEDQTSLQAALTFLSAQQDTMATVRTQLDELKRKRRDIPDGSLIGPLNQARMTLDEALEKLKGLVDGYERANTMLPELFGMNGARNYLLLPQNDTELMPSGGLISSYGIATFDQGSLTSIQLEYFGSLFDRWQAATGEYIEPPAPLKNYLKKHLSWGLGEAGWYPDFPTTADLARTFVAKGGAPDTNGTIAFDLQFVEELLRLLGPVKVPDYDVTVTAANLAETTLLMTRDEAYVPGSQRKAFLSYLARGILSEVFAAPKEQWVDLLKLLDRMGRERHLQLNFGDDRLQDAAAAYGLDGAIVNPPDGDFLLIADSSVQSTKLNMILKNSAVLEVSIQPDGSVRNALTYRVSNPFPEWAAKHDPVLVKRLMHEGVYGSYMRLYTPPGTRFDHLTVNGVPNGLEQSDIELGKQVFGRFFTVTPGGSATAGFVYTSPSSLADLGEGVSRYRLYLQKEAGTRAMPIEVRVHLPQGATLVSTTLDGESKGTTRLLTDLRTDREVEVLFKGKP